MYVSLGEKGRTMNKKLHQKYVWKVKHITKCLWKSLIGITYIHQYKFNDVDNNQPHAKLGKKM